MNYSQIILYITRNTSENSNTTFFLFNTPYHVDNAQKKYQILKGILRATYGYLNLGNY